MRVLKALSGDYVRTAINCHRLANPTTLPTNEAPLVAHIALLLSPLNADAEPLGSLNRIAFAEKVSCEPFIPIVRSGPWWKLTSLSTLVTRGRGKPYYIAEIVTYGDDARPLLLLSVKSALVICGEGNVLGEVLAHGLERDLASLMHKAGPSIYIESDST